jgi:hypothetical protein
MNVFELQVNADGLMPYTHHTSCHTPPFTLADQTLNMGPEDPTSASTSNAPTGGLTMALGGLGDKIVGAVDGAAEKFAALMGDSSGVHVQDVASSQVLWSL